MSVVLLLSPHLDDAVLSCGGRILHHVARGERVVVLTVFSHADPDDAAGWGARREEDRTAAARLGAETEWMGLPDAPFREPAYHDFDTLTGPLAPGDAATARRLVERLRARVEQLRPVTLYVPLAVGVGTSMRRAGAGDCVLVNFGDGASSEGAVHEAMSFAATPCASALMRRSTLRSSTTWAGASARARGSP